MQRGLIGEYMTFCDLFISGKINIMDNIWYLKLLLFRHECSTYRDTDTYGTRQLSENGHKHDRGHGNFFKKSFFSCVNVNCNNKIFRLELLSDALSTNDECLFTYTYLLHIAHWTQCFWSYKYFIYEKVLRI